ncbi:hypothetical protein SAY87_014629 [Trapa incisa]|uniref:Uncharacterized protein n=1 Tax=Trapa incisa TaxID=236973 RepID=A0AAN7JLU1_9MYRT|nr:hypothetical protein SAY87_014629 [Trapa incisa]
MLWNEWISYMEHHKQICYGVNSHNEKSIHKFLNFLQAQIRLLKKLDYNSTTVMLVGIPNVGKSVLQLWLVHQKVQVHAEGSCNA